MLIFSKISMLFTTFYFWYGKDVFYIPVKVKFIGNNGLTLLANVSTKDLGASGILTFILLS